jgi:hypothetical protein
MRQPLRNVFMKHDDDLAVLLQKISMVANRYDLGPRVLKEDDKIAVVMGTAHRDYMAVMTSEQRAQGTALVMSNNLEAVMRQLSINKT